MDLRDIQLRSKSSLVCKDSASRSSPPHFSLETCAIFGLTSSSATFVHSHGCSEFQFVPLQHINLYLVLFQTCGLASVCVLQPYYHPSYALFSCQISKISIPTLKMSFSDHLMASVQPFMYSNLNTAIHRLVMPLLMVSIIGMNLDYEPDMTVQISPYSIRARCFQYSQALVDVNTLEVVGHSLFQPLQQYSRDLGRRHGRAVAKYNCRQILNCIRCHADLNERALSVSNGLESAACQPPTAHSFLAFNTRSYFQNDPYHEASAQYDVDIRVRSKSIMIRNSN